MSLWPGIMFQNIFNVQSHFAFRTEAHNFFVSIVSRCTIEPLLVALHTPGGKEEAFYVYNLL